jgi:Ca-activated chloride channel homolog
MKGRRLEQVKAAAHKIIDTMSDRDIISIISFSDRAEVVVPATPIYAAERHTLKAHISTMQASGGTEIMQGLIKGISELHKHLSRKYVNHLVLLTDGRTYGDEEDCILLAESAAEDGVTISGMGIGDEWNDEFLDKLASVTGGTSAYIDASSTVTNFLQKQVRSLGQAYAERLQLSVAPDASMSLEAAFKIAPSPMPLDSERQPMPLGTLEYKRPLSVLLQLKLPPLETPGMLPVARFDVTGDILWKDLDNYKAIADMTLEVSETAEPTPPPKAILNALGKLTLYRMQEKAQQALDAGNVEEATRKLEDLATRLLAGGQTELAEAAMSEARHVASTHTLSDEGSKFLKYGTRALLLPASSEDSSTH